MAHDPLTGPTSGPVNKNKAKPVSHDRRKQAAAGDPSGPVGKTRGTKATKHSKPPATPKREASRALWPKKKRHQEPGSKDGKDAVPAIRPKMVKRAKHGK